MSLETILKEIKEVKPFADGDAEAGPIETLAGRRGRKNQAIETLRRLKNQYRDGLMSTSQYIVVTGSERNKLTEALTSGKQGLFSADPEEFYSDIAKRINPALYQGRRTGASDIFDVMGRVLWDKTNELGLSEYNQLIFKSNYDKEITTLAQLTDFVKTAINDQVGTEIVGLQAIESIIDSAIEKNHTSNSTSIVLNVTDEKLALQILNSFHLPPLKAKTYLVIAGEVPKTLGNSKAVEDAIIVEEVNKDSIKQVINSLKAKRNS